jgi:hypothetical protein
MSVRLSCYLLLATILIVAPAAFGQPTIVNFDFGAVPVGCPGWGFTYQGAALTCTYPVTQNFNMSPGFGWTLGWVVARSGSPLFGGAGVTGPNSAMNPPSFTGMPFNQAVILQSFGSFVLQAVPGFTAGSYTLSFYLGGREVSYNGPQRVKAMIDGSLIGTWDVPVGMPFTRETATFTVSTDGIHVLEFMGMNPYDTTAFISYVTITPAGDDPQR